MMQLSLKNDDSSLCYNVIITHQKFLNWQIFDFSSDIDFNTKIDICRDVISLIFKQCDPRRPKGASGGHFVSTSRAAQASEARLILISRKLFIILVLNIAMLNSKSFMGIPSAYLKYLCFFSFAVLHHYMVISLTSLPRLRLGGITTSNIVLPYRSYYRCTI